jgi:hypothetical protein
MFREIRKKYLILLAISLILAALTVSAQYTKWCSFRHVDVTPGRFENLATVCPDTTGINIFNIPLEEIADNLIKKEKVVSVEVGYSFPHGLKICVNGSDPIALIVDVSSGNIYRMDKNRILYPFHDTKKEINCPVVTGVRSNRLYKQTNNKRLKLIVGQLVRIENDFEHLYGALSNINLSGDMVTLHFEGLPYEIKTYTGRLYDCLSNFNAFLLNYNPDLQGIEKLDMRLNNLIIAES